MIVAVYPALAHSQTVSVRNGEGEHGFGWMFGYEGRCYVLMPKHVAGLYPKVSIMTSAPVVTSSATTIAPFWPEIDLAVGVGGSALDSRCPARLDDLEETPQSLNAAMGYLHRLTPAGEEERTALRIGNRNYLTFDAELAGGQNTIAQGTSGAFLFVDGKPLGMAVTSNDTSRATFIRSGEILIHVRRYLSEQAGAYVPPEPDEPVTPAPAAEGALPLVFEAATMPPVNPRFAPENMLGGGQFVFSPAARMSFVLRLEETAPVSRVVLRSTPSEGRTMPKRIILNWSLEADGRNFREWTRGEMGRDGVFDTGLLAPRNIRALQVIVLNAWSSGDIAIDSVVAQ
ncbi:hypothetical protein [Cereibacter sphaeroides]|jgi:hypothetical protein|nr:hypothetical protein [Cereibacter sphaeroides]AMJ50146.1 hypothetical protein APX01_21590 [Cereibacter sphaeroides]ATN65893.1 hypothetical protein A3857_21475 [Cereibacter sphaeroides]QJC86766.1 hypothetical protein HGN32_21540 [Cereibacter sphaeroides]